jgi:8-oxo-dGTP diphosphatase
VFDVAVTYIMRHHEGVDQVLLGEKLTGLGVGKIVGPGGKAKPGEAPADAAVREIREEVGLHVAPEDLSAIAVISYPFLDRPALSQRSFVFTTRVFQGTLVSSAELHATWWPVAAIPYERMWSDAALWLPQALSGAMVEETFHIGHDDQVVRVGS